MVVYQSLVDRFVTLVIGKHVAEDLKVQNERWYAWLQRKEAVDAEGAGFNQPTPGTSQEPSGK